jgi:hypothetical protein
MRQIACVFAVIVVSFSPAYGQDKSAGTAIGEIEKAIVAKEQALHEAVAKQDKASFQSLTVPNGTWTTSSGFVEMRLLAGDLGVFRISKFAIVNPHIKQLDDESALVIYVRTGEGTFGEQPFAPTALASTVWVKRDGSWRAIHHQETDLIK